MFCPLHQTSARVGRWNHEQELIIITIDNYFDLSFVPLSAFPAMWFCGFSQSSAQTQHPRRKFSLEHVPSRVACYQTLSRAAGCGDRNSRCFSYIRDIGRLGLAHPVSLGRISGCWHNFQSLEKKAALCQKFGFLQKKNNLWMKKKWTSAGRRIVDANELSLEWMQSLRIPFRPVTTLFRQSLE